MKKSTVVLAIAAICMLAVIGCKNAAVTPPEQKPTTMLSARFTDSESKTYDFSLEKPAAGSTVVSGKLYSQALNKTFSLKGPVNTTSGDFTLSMRSSTAGIHADVTGNTKTDGTELTLTVSNKDKNAWIATTPIKADAASIKTGTAAVEVTGTVDQAAQDVGLPDEALGTWKMYPSYCKVKEPIDLVKPHEYLNSIRLDTSSKISEPYYAVKNGDRWYLHKKGTVDNKTTFWNTNETIDKQKMEQSDWVEYAKSLKYYTKDDADFVVTQTVTIDPFSFQSYFESVVITDKVTKAELKTYFGGVQEISFLEIEKKGDDFDLIIGNDKDGYFKVKASIANNILKYWQYTGKKVATIEEARALTILTDEGYALIFAR